MLGRMVRFDSSTPCKAAHIVLTALSRRVQRTHRREREMRRRTREDIVAKILHKRLAKSISPAVQKKRRCLNHGARLRE